MAAVRSAARALGGAVTLDSRPGRGTTLRFRFPVAAGAVGRAAA
jgi:signal transduction histidine kinase